MPSTFSIWRKLLNDTLTAVGLDKAIFDHIPSDAGGATHFFSTQPSFDKLLVHGRWQAVKAARIYVNEGLSVLAELQLPHTPFTKNLRSQCLKFSPKPCQNLIMHLARCRAGQIGRSTTKKGSPVSWVWPDQGYP